MSDKLYIEAILPFEQLCGLVLEEDLAAVAGFRKQQRKEEFLMWRAVVYRHLPGAEIRYNSVGAPVVCNFPVHLGVSHCPGYVAVALSDQPCAVDIESLSRNFDRIASRFASRRELSLDGGEYLLPALWCGKEALYKYSGRQQLDWIRDLRIESLDMQRGRMTGRIADEAPVVIDVRIERNICIAAIF